MSDLQYAMRPLQWTGEFKCVLKTIARDIELLEGDRKRKLASYHTSIALGGYLGVHSQQLLAIKWEDVINKKKTDTFWNNNEAGHRVSFHSELLTIVRRNYKICRPFADHHFIVSNPLKYQTRLISRTYNNTLHHILLNCGIDIGDEGSHILRKTGAYRIFKQKGGDLQALQYISEFLNHKSLSMTRTYLDLTKHKACKS